MSQLDEALEDTEQIIFNTYCDLLLAGRKEDAATYLSAIQALSNDVLHSDSFTITFEGVETIVPTPEVSSNDVGSAEQLDLPLREIMPFNPINVQKN